MNNVCYLCGREAKYRFKNGKYCCSKSVNSCPEKRRIDSESKKGKNPFENRPHPKGFFGKKPWNYGLNADNCEKIKMTNIKLTQFRKNNPNIGFNKNSRHTDETKKKISESMKIVGGGYRKGSGVGCSGSYSGMWCDSLYELSYLLYCIDNSKNIKRCERTFNLSTKRYTPDFIVDDEYIEIACFSKDYSYVDLVEKEFNIKVKKIYQNVMNVIREWAVEKYGDLELLYDK